MSGIQIPQVPANNRVPLVAMEIKEGYNVGLSKDDYRAISIMEKLDSGVGEAFKVYQVTSEEEVIKLFGKNSSGHLFYRSYRKNNSGVLSMMPIVKPTSSTSGVAASYTLKVDSVPTSDGYLRFYLFGELVEVYIDKTIQNTKPLVASKILEAIKLLKYIPVTSEIENTSDVKLTSLHASIIIPKIPFEIEYNETGITFATPVEVSGVSNGFNITDALDKIGEDIYDFVAIPYSDNTTLTRAKDWSEERRTADTALDGHIFAIKDVDMTTTTTFQLGINSVVLTVFANQGRNPYFETLGSIIGVISRESMINPAKPFQYKDLSGVIPVGSPFSREQRNLLLQNGISTLKKDGSVLQIERVSTLAAETSNLRDFNDVLSVTIARRDLSRFWATRYPDRTIDDVGTGAPNSVSLETFKLDYLGRYSLWVGNGWAQPLNAEDVKDVRAEKDGDTVKLYLPFRLINQLRMTLGILDVRSDD